MDDWGAEMIQFDSRMMDWGRKCSGLVPQTVAVNAINASYKIILLFWNLGRGVYVFFWVRLLSHMAAVECPFGQIWMVSS